MLDLVVPTVAQLDAAVSAIDELTGSPAYAGKLRAGLFAERYGCGRLAGGKPDVGILELAILRLLRIRPHVRLSEAHRVRLAEWVEQRVAAN